MGISACWENFVLPRSGEIRLAIRFPGTGVNTHTHTGPQPGLQPQPAGHAEYRQDKRAEAGEFFVEAETKVIRDVRDENKCVKKTPSNKAHTFIFYVQCGQY